MSVSSPFGGAQSADANSPWLVSFLGLSSVFAAVGTFSQAYLGSSIRLLILGSVIEAGRRLCQWLMVRFRIQYSMTAQFDEGDPAYEWIVLFLTQENVWRRSRDFLVNATNSRRKWSVQTWVDPKIKGNAEYVPTYQQPQLFRWRGHWLDIKRSNESGSGRFTTMGTFQQVSSIFVTIYTLDMNLLSQLVEDARARYVEVNRPNVVIHLADSPHYGSGMTWNHVKHKVRRPLSSVILQDGVVDSLVRDAQEFLATEDWYLEAGIPHRRGYLLYGPPGTGKTSTIYALAGALNIEIYSLSLAASFVDDSFLQRAASSIPKHALFLIEDIDCAFASREDEDEIEERSARMMLGGGGSPFGFGGEQVHPGGHGGTRSLVTLSGLLNVIDGVGSEEGKLFFATTNYFDRLDPALLRPGRIDRKIAYELATTDQARALFVRFFPEARFPDLAEAKIAPPAEGNLSRHTVASEPIPTDSALTADPATMTTGTPAPTRTTITTLSKEFAAAIPPAEFSTAELQCYLQAYKTAPVAAVEGARAWVAEQREERRAREAREVERRRRVRERVAQMQAGMGMGMGAGMNVRPGLGVRGGEVQGENAKADAEVQADSEASQDVNAGEGEGEGSPAQMSDDSEFSSYVDGALPASESEERA
ncbi:hypothetical protein C8R44DRAFT_853057 [Mycena epipterygia]|nr:hypothetical protein C8R44DRAFT_853057 [Mycena epipterygia]